MDGAGWNRRRALFVGGADKALSAMSAVRLRRPWHRRHQETMSALPAADPTYQGAAPASEGVSQLLRSGGGVGGPGCLRGLARLACFLGELHIEELEVRVSMLVPQAFAIPSYGDSDLPRQPERLVKVAEGDLTVLDFGRLSFQPDVRQGRQEVGAQSKDLKGFRIDPSQALGKRCPGNCGHLEGSTQLGFCRLLSESKHIRNPAKDFLAPEVTKGSLGLVGRVEAK